MNLIPFQYEGAEIRIVDQDGEPWFVASDVAKTLGYTNPRKAVIDHCKGSNKTLLPSNGGTQEATIISERDVYRLIMKSKLPSAQQFEEWVVGEVIPSIRKTGNYQLSGERLVAQALIEASRIIEEQKPAVEFYKAVSDSRSAISMREVAKVLGTGQNRLFLTIRENKILMDNNEPYQEYVDRGWFRVIENKFQKPDGSVHIYIRTLVFQKGVDGIRKILQRVAA